MIEKHDKIIKQVSSKIKKGERNITVKYSNSRELEKLETEFILNFGEQILETGRIQFKKA
jgi:ABC-type Fe3+-citrate transport system substrate-binding protein